MNTLGERLKDIRENLGLKQNIVAEKIGISNKVLSNYEHNISSPDVHTLKLICDFYNISSDYLLDISKNQTYNTKLQNDVLCVSEESIHITDDETNCLNYYRRLNTENKDYIKGQMIQLYKEQIGISKSKKTT